MIALEKRTASTGVRGRGDGKYREDWDGSRRQGQRLATTSQRPEGLIARTFASGGCSRRSRLRKANPFMAARRQVIYRCTRKVIASGSDWSAGALPKQVHAAAWSMRGGTPRGNRPTRAIATRWGGKGKTLDRCRPPRWVSARALGGSDALFVTKAGSRDRPAVNGALSRDQGGSAMRGEERWRVSRKDYSADD